MHRIRLALLSLLVIGFVTLLVVADPKPNAPPTGPFSPREEMATFKIAKGFKVELVASEPDVVDPVCMAFDENGRIFVAEMRGYPNEGVGTGEISSGRIKRLEDLDGDGVFEKSTLFAEGLRFPTSVMPYKGGLLVANAPELLYLEDTNGDGQADKKRVLYTGFGVKNIQQLLNSLQWGLDNWIYGCAGNEGGTIACPEKPDMPAVTLRNRGIRFKPDVPGSLEPTSGGGQYGLTPDDFQQWFTATNSQHLRHIVLPDHYLQRNPALAVSAVILDIPDHGAACKVHRISAFEGWREERTKRRKDAPDAARFAATELVPGGFITSGCSPVTYLADRYPEAYRGNIFVCDPANNLIHRDVLEPKGATFVAKRAADETDCEFLASTDNWFRPVWLTLGPDGGLYVLDFYREVIETPLSLPDDIKAKLNLQSRERGRIWRIVPTNERRGLPPPFPGKATTADLVKHLENANIWWRLTAQRLLVERADKEARPALRNLLESSTSAPGRAHALWTLHALKMLDDSQIEKALKDSSAGVREQALRVAEERLATSEKLRSAAAALAEDASPRVRFQFALTAGAAESSVLVTALAKLLRRDDNDAWTQTAALSSTTTTAPALLETLSRDKEFITNASSGRQAVLTRLAAMVGATAKDEQLGRVLGVLSPDGDAAWQAAVLEGLGQGLRGSGRPLAKLWEQPPESLKEAVAKVRPFFEKAATMAGDDKRMVGERLAAVRLLGAGPSSLAVSALEPLLTPQNPSELQLAAVRALSGHESPRIAEILLSTWPGYSPAVRREAVEALFMRPERVKQLLTAIEKKTVLPSHIEPVRLDQLRKHPDPEVRLRALTLLAGQATPDRKKIVEDHMAVLELKADTGRGKAVFKKVCATCHRLENEGIEVGPDLLATLRNKSGEQLVTDILDPSREVDPRYLNYLVSDKAGRSFTGMVAAETASSLTLRRAEKAEDVILRNQIDEIEATAKSIMPEGLEMQVSKQELADVIAYLRLVATPK